MAQKTIEDKIDALFEARMDSGTDELKDYLEGLHCAHGQAEVSFRRVYATLLLAWAVSWLIGGGFIEEGQVASFKITNIRNLMPFCPPLVGPISCPCFAYLATIVYLMPAISRCYAHLLPNAEEFKLHCLLFPPTFRSIELVLRSESDVLWLNKLSEAWLIFLAICFVLLPLAAVIHVSYLMRSTGLFSTLWCILSVVVASVFWVRGAIVLAISMTSIK